MYITKYLVKCYLCDTPSIAPYLISSFQRKSTTHILSKSITISSTWLRKKLECNLNYIIMQNSYKVFKHFANFWQWKRSFKRLSSKTFSTFLRTKARKKYHHLKNFIILHPLFLSLRKFSQKIWPKAIFSRTLSLLNGSSLWDKNVKTDFTSKFKLKNVLNFFLTADFFEYHVKNVKDVDFEIFIKF